MCRRSILLGIGLIAFGAGMLVGCWLESEFMRYCIGLGVIAVGVLAVQKR